MLDLNDICMSIEPNNIFFVAMLYFHS